MNGRLRARTLLIAGACAIGVLASLLLFLVINQSLRTAGLPEETRRDLSVLVGRAFVPAFLAVLIACSAIGVYIADMMAQPLRRLRAELPDLARGDRIQPQTQHRIEEQAALTEAIATLVRDLREQRRTVEQERTELSVLFESGTEGLLQVSRQGRIVHMNRAASSLLGLPTGAHGQPISSLIRVAGLRELIRTATAGIATEPRDLLLDDRQVTVTSRPLPAEGGALIIVSDLTEVKRLEAVRRDFVANVSHELKTPLTSIRGYVETLQQDDLPPELRAQFLDVIHKNTTRIQRIVDDLLDLSRLQSGGWRPEPHPVDAAQIAYDVWDSCRADARKNIEFEVVLNGPSLIAADPSGMRQVYSNLFDNSLRYTPEGGTVVVSIAAAPDGRVEIEVRDSGSGIPRDALPRIFERFYRVDPARSRGEGGTGLGLAIVKHLLERMEGEISAESELGKGTTIRFRLPAA